MSEELFVVETPPSGLYPRVVSGSAGQPHSGVISVGGDNCGSSSIFSHSLLIGGEPPNGARDAEGKPVS